MADCDSVLKICANSSLNEIHRLIVEDGMKVRNACEKVCDEFNAANPTATTTVASLRQAYYRNNKPAKKKSVTVSQKSAPKIPMAPIEDNTTTITGCTNCFALEVEISALKAQLKDLEANNLNLVEELLKLDTKVDVPKPGQLPRAKVFDFIKAYGNHLQVKAISITNLTNDRMLQVLQGVIATRLKTVPHSGIPKEILEAKEIV